MRYIIFVLISIIAFLLALRSCEQPKQAKTDTSQLRQFIATNKAKLTVLKPIIIYKDSIRTKYVTKWKEVRHDSLIPCPEKLAIADTVIYRDSSLISSLKLLCKIDSSIIADQSKVIVSDSITIKGLKKEVKKQKRQKRILAAIAILLGGYSVIK